ncbi:DUF6503 family protein [Marinigracilibium pacificum]|uniref:Deoxyribose-phosphate aldolase n=1 Tax=Marinigracilibium pacificum TaxID=2729599 RepID=A0A848J1G9_9BACT|nr:DUF6503 family protein [Marinigracilibium pacificum]NMM49656.1 hypothetical protein [Marinigracilibium pacificum]
MNKIFSVAVLVWIFSACTGHKNQTEELNKASNIINETIKAHGMDKLENGKLSFIFRNGHYTMENNSGIFRYERLISKNDSVYQDIITNDGFVRKFQGDTLKLTSTEEAKYKNGLNAVIYFASLPKSLSDAAVKADYLGDMNLKGNDYYKIRVTFNENGGGKDYDDVFVYWVNKDTDLVDYLAYEYHTDGGGMRFREAFNKREVNGVVVQDYKNYKPLVDGIMVQDMDELFLNGDIELVSEIKSEEPEVILY